MKTIIFLKCLIILCIFFYSCTKEKEKNYSCNPNVNIWIKHNLNNIGNISYDDLIAYKLEYQKGIFQASTPEKRCSFWIEKINRVLALNWEKSEFEFIKKLKDSISLSWYEDDIDSSEFSHIDFFLQSWKNEGLLNLNFSLEMLHAIAGRIDYDVEPLNPHKLMQTNFSTYGGGVFIGGGIGVDANKDCRCSKRADFCNYPLECKSAECEETTHGCGWLWTYKCTGNCQ
jgi:hypothetical protein